MGLSPVRLNLSFLSEFTDRTCAIATLSLCDDSTWIMYSTRPLSSEADSADKENTFFPGKKFLTGEESLATVKRNHLDHFLLTVPKYNVEPGGSPAVSDTTFAEYSPAFIPDGDIYPLVRVGIYTICAY